MPSSEFSFDVFLSHNQAQKPWTRDLARRLRRDGFRVWFDEWVLSKRLGRDFTDQLEQGIQESRKVVLVWSPEFFSNNWPRFEASMIQQIDPIGQADRVVPLLHTQCDIPPKWGFRQRLSFVNCPPGSHEFEFAYQMLVHNLDPSRFVVPDPERFRPEKLKFARKVRFVAKLWRWTSYLAGIWAGLFFLALVISSIQARSDSFSASLDRAVTAALFGILLEIAVVAALIARGLHRLRPWGRTAALWVSAITAFWYPLSWYTLWILLRQEDAKRLYAEICEDAL